MWVHANCDGVTQAQYKAIKILSSIDSSVYFCNVNKCVTRFRNITNEWIQHQAYGSSQSEPPTSTLTQDLELLATVHKMLEKTVSDLSSQIDNLQSQESKLTDQIKTTSDVLGRHNINPAQYSYDRKSNIVLYGIDESPSKRQNMKDCKKTSRLF